MLRWYLVHTKPGREVVARCNLERQGYEVYLPLVLQPVQRRGRWQERVAPLFPRYLFLGLDEGRQPLAPVRSTPGVASVVRYGADYAIVPDHVVRDLRMHADPETSLHRLNHMPEFVPGAAIKVAAGPFTDLEGVFQRHVGNDRVVVLLDILGKAASVRVPYEFVIPCYAS